MKTRFGFVKALALVSALLISTTNSYGGTISANAGMTGKGASSPLTTKGDVYTRNSSTDARLAVGTNGQILTADSTAATGLKWASSGGGSGNVTEINSDATASQTLTVGTSGTDFAIADDAAGGHAFNLPSASATARGVVSTGTQTFAGTKTFAGLLATTVDVGTNKIYLSGGDDFPASTWDSGAVLVRTGGSGSAPFDQAGSLIYRTRLSNTAGRSTHYFYTGATPTLAFKIDEAQKATFAGAIGTPLTASRALVTDGSGNLAVSAVTSTVLGYLDVGSSLTTLLAAKAPLASPTFTGVATFANGSAAAPSITFADATKGFYHSGTNYIGITIAGAIAAEWTTGLYSVYGSSGTAEYAFQRSGAVGNIGLYGGGSTSARIALYGETHASQAKVTQFINNSSISGSISATGMWVQGISGTTTGFHTVYGRGLDIYHNANTTAYVQLSNLSNTSAASAGGYFQVAGTSAGSPFLTLDISGGQKWTIANQNDNSDRFVIGNSATIGSSLRFVMEPLGQVDIGGGGGSATVMLTAGSSSATVQATTTGTAFGVNATHGSTANTTAIYGGDFAFTTGAGSYTSGIVADLRLRPIAKGASSTITRAFGLYVEDQTVGGTGNAAIADNASFSGAFFLNSTSTNPSLLTGILNASAGVRTKYSTANVTAVPTAAEFVSACGAAATVGAGFICIINDNNGGTAEYIAWSDGTNYFYASGTLSL